MPVRSKGSVLPGLFFPIQNLSIKRPADKPAFLNLFTRERIAPATISAFMDKGLRTALSLAMSFALVRAKVSAILVYPLLFLPLTKINWS
jgi:hypothetical protein